MRGVRCLLMLSLLAACELKPDPGKQAEPPPAAGSGSGSGSAVAVAQPTTVAPPTPTPTPSPVPEAAPSAAAPSPSEGCQKVGVHIADVLISLAQAPQKQVMEQDRTKLVRQAGISCQKNQWTDEKIACFNLAATQEAFDTCNRMPNKS